MGRLIALLVVVVYPLTELLVAAWLAARIGWAWVMVLALVGLLAGLLVMSRAGRRAADGLSTAARTGSLPGGDVGDSALLFLAGLLLAVPGFVTDVLGLALLLPPLRRVVRRAAGATLGRRIRAGGYSMTTATVDGVTVTRLHEGDVIAGEVVERHDAPPEASDDDPPPALPSS
jgi:UPF0716 protein FxsA